MDLSHCLLLPIRVGVDLTKANAINGRMPAADSSSKGYFKIKKTINGILLFDQRRQGASKLLFRLKRPDEAIFSPEHYAAIENFVEAVADLSKDGDESLRATLLECDLGDAEAYLRLQNRFVLQRFGLNGRADQNEIAKNDLHEKTRGIWTVKES
jgi:hypothetical protein